MENKTDETRNIHKIIDREKLYSLEDFISLKFPEFSKSCETKQIKKYAIEKGISFIYDADFYRSSRSLIQLVDTQGNTFMYEIYGMNQGLKVADEQTQQTENFQEWNFEDIELITSGSSTYQNHLDILDRAISQILKMKKEHKNESILSILGSLRE